MPHSRSLGRLAFLWVLILAFPLAALASQKQATGDLVSVSPATQTLTLRAADRTQVILRVNARSHLTRNGAQVQLASLALRDHVTAHFDTVSTTVLKLTARGPRLTSTRGVLARVNATDQTLAVTTVSGRHRFKVVASTLLVRNGGAASLQDLRAGDAVLVHSRPAGQGAAIAMDVEDDGPEEDSVEGAITTLNGNDVTITPEQGAAVTVHADNSTIIIVRDASGEHAATLADLATGMKAEAEFDPSTMIASKIEAQAANSEDQLLEVHGTVATVDTGAGTLTINPDGGGAAITLGTDSNTKISLNGAPATLGDIPQQAKVEAQYDSVTLIAAKIEAETEQNPNPQSEVEGVVTAVSASSITIAPEEGAPVTLTTDTSTQITLDGVAVALSAIPLGAQAHAEFDSTTLVASSLRATSAQPQELGEVEGSVTAASATSLTIAPEEGSPVTLQIDSTTMIFVDGTAATAGDIQVGDRADAKFDKTTMVAKQIEVEHQDSGGH